MSDGSADQGLGGEVCVCVCLFVCVRVFVRLLYCAPSRLLVLTTYVPNRIDSFGFTGFDVSVVKVFLKAVRAEKTAVQQQKVLASILRSVRIYRLGSYLTLILFRDLPAPRPHISSERRRMKEEKYVDAVNAAHEHLSQVGGS